MSPRPDIIDTSQLKDETTIKPKLKVQVMLFPSGNESTQILAIRVEGLIVSEAGNKLVARHAVADAFAQLKQGVSTHLRIVLYT